MKYNSVRIILICLSTSIVIACAIFMYWTHGLYWSFAPLITATIGYFVSDTIYSRKIKKLKDYANSRNYK